MSEDKRFKWLLEVEVPEYWVKSGFDFHEDTCPEVAETIIKFAYHDKVMVRVVQAPDPKDLRRSQDHEEQAVMNVPQRITTPPSPAPNPPPSTPSHAARYALARHLPTTCLSTAAGLSVVSLGQKHPVTGGP